MNSIKKFIICFISIIFFYSCENINIVPHNNEEIYLFKAETRLINLKTDTITKKFLSFDNIESGARKKSQTSCDEYLKKINQDHYACKFIGYGFTEYGKRVRDM